MENNQKQTYHKPPKLANWILKRVLPSKDFFILDGDFEETYNDIFSEIGSSSARFWYWKQVLISTIPLIYHSVIRSLGMLESYVKVAYRNALRSKTYTFINIFGLSVGIACCTLVFLFIKSEFTYDQFHKDAKNIHLVSFEYDMLNDGMPPRNLTMVAPILAEELQTNYPEINTATSYFEGTASVKHGQLFEKEKINFVASTFFEFFSFPLEFGSSQPQMLDLKSVIISQEVKNKYFGSENPIGKTMLIKYHKDFIQYTVSGVLKSIPENSTLRLNIVAPIENFKYWLVTRRDIESGKTNENWKNAASAYSFIKVSNNTHTESLEQKLPSLRKGYGLDGMWRNTSESSGAIDLISLDDIHFKLPITKVKGNPQYSYILSGIGIIVLLIACINFTNISIGLVSKRLKEIGMRKVFGARRDQLMKQYFCEIIFLTFFAMCLGLVLTNISLPVFNEFADKQLKLELIKNGSILLFLPFLMLGISLVTGCYPALIVSRFQTIRILRKVSKIGGNNYFSKSLIFVQFSISIILIASTINMSDQIRFLSSMDKGFDAENVITIEPNNRILQAQFENFKNEIKPHKDILNVSAGNNYFGLFDLLGTKMNVSVNGSKFEANKFPVDKEYIDTFGIRLTSGRNFEDESDLYKSIIVNKKFIEAFNIKTPLGTVITNKDIINRLAGVGYNEKRNLGTKFDTPTVVGIVDNFHFDSFNNEIKPAFLYLSDFDVSKIIIKTSGENTKTVIAHLESAWYKNFPDDPFIYKFYDEDVKAQYADDENWMKIITSVTLIALMLSALGLFGLASLSVSKRTKEIGVRKVLGASSFAVTSLFNKEFLTIVLVANCIALPVAYSLMNNWLQSFAYRIELAVSTFILSATAAIVIATITVSLQALKAAYANPVDSLRYE